MTWLHESSLAAYGTNRLVDHFRVTFLLARSGNEDASQKLELIVTELASRDIEETSHCQAHLVRFREKAAK